MLNLLKDYNKNKLTGFKHKLKIFKFKPEDKVEANRHFPISTKEWFNSTYSYDKNAKKSMPTLDYIIYNLIKMYFNLDSMVNKGEKFSRRRSKAKYHTTNKILVGNTEMKHYNDKIIITIYTYNKTKKFIFKNLEKLYKKVFRNFFVDFYRVNTLFKNKFNFKNFNTSIAIKKKIRKFLNRKYMLRFKLKRKKRKYLNYRKLRKYYLIKTYKNLYINNLINYSVTNNEKFKAQNNIYYLYFKYLSLYDRSFSVFRKFLYRSNTIIKLLKEKKFLLKNLIDKNKFLKLKGNILYINKSFLKNKLSKELLYLKYNQMLMTERYKYSYVYLNRLKNVIENIYAKNIEFNIINLKYLHLDSKIFSVFMGLKMKNRKNRSIKILKKALKLTKITRLNSFLFSMDNLYFNNLNRLKLKYNLLNNNRKLDLLDLFFYNIFKLKKVQINPEKTNKVEKRQKFIYKSVKFRKITGIRFEAKGRLTRRLTASRAIFKLRYKGNLKNIDNLNNLSSTIMRGYLKSNIDYTNINSKTRNGCFGLKGWISSK